MEDIAGPSRTPATHGVEEDVTRLDEHIAVPIDEDIPFDDHVEDAFIPADRDRVVADTGAPLTQEVLTCYGTHRARGVWIGEVHNWITIVTN